ncbi:MAG: hypothetical protein AAF411_29490, partial [Myxococcota bacterium]
MNHKVADRVCALSALALAAQAAVRAADEPPPQALVEGALATLNVVAAALFWRRRAPTAVAPRADLLMAGVSLLAAGFLLRDARPHFGMVSASAFAVAASLAALALIALGPSFSILPARRGVVARGPYAWVRHPAYAAELAMATI